MIFSWQLDITSDELVATLSNVEAESTYYIQIQAKNSKGYSPMSQLAAVITKQGSMVSFNIIREFFLNYLHQQTLF